MDVLTRKAQMEAAAPFIQLAKSASGRLHFIYPSSNFFFLPFSSFLIGSVNLSVYLFFHYQCALFLCLEFHVTLFNLFCRRCLCVSMYVKGKACVELLKRAFAKKNLFFYGKILRMPNVQALQGTLFPPLPVYVYASV